MFTEPQGMNAGSWIHGVYQVYIKRTDMGSINIYCSTKLRSMFVVSKQEYSSVQNIVACHWVGVGYILLLLQRF